MIEKWLCENTVIGILDYVHKLTRTCEIEHGNLKQRQAKMKQWYDKDAMIREFKQGETLLCYCLFIVIHYKLNIVGHM